MAIISLNICLMSCVIHAFTSVHCCLVATYWERADLLAPVCDVYLCFVTFPCGNLGQVQNLIELIPDPCHLSYFEINKTFFICQYLYEDAI